MCRRHKQHANTMRRGFSLPELLIAIAIMAVMAAAVGSLALSVESGSEYSQGRAATTQHARVIRDRVERTLRDATANEQFPGFFVLPTAINSWTFPDTLIVWHPNGTPANPNGMPLVSELVVFTPDPAAPSRFLEVRTPTANRTAPALANTAGWRNEIDAMLANADSEIAVLTNLLRTAAVQDASSNVFRRGAARFHVRLRPSATQWSAYQSNAINWQDLDWPQDIYGSSAGLRQAWCSIELQLMPGEDSRRTDPNGDTAIPIFGSAAKYYELKK